jgi:peptidoglycan biosynthesis/recognition FemAB-like protein
MNQLVRKLRTTPFSPHSAAGGVLTIGEIARCRRWPRAFASERKDRRYYELVEDTIRQGFEYRYFAISDARGEVRAIAPCFVHELDLLAGTGSRIRRTAALLRRVWPRLMRARTLMIGCVAGQGHLDDPDEVSRSVQAELLAAAIAEHAAGFGARLVVFKEFPASYRDDLACLKRAGYTRIPSFPMTRLNIDYSSFEDFMCRALSRKTRKDLRVKFRTAAAAPAIALSVVGDITPMIDEVYPLYLQVYRRAQYRFEQLTPEYLCRIGRLMPDKVRFFVWRQQGRTVAFSLCLVHEDDIFAEYLGFDYAVALDLHLYHYAFRDVVTWAIEHGYKTFRSNGANYDPKLHLRCVLDPLDLYVRHTSRVANIVLSKLLPLLEPTRYDPILPRFPNYDELWGRE